MVNNSWKESSLTDLCSVQIGLTHTPKYILHGVPFLSAKDLNNGELSFKDAKYISQEEFLTISDAAKPKNGDIVFGRVGTLGNPCIVNTENDFAIFVSLGYLRTKEGVLNEFIYHWLKSDLFHRLVEEKIAGSSQKNLNTGWLKEFFVVLPPQNEQKCIAQALSDVDSMISSLKKLIAKKKLLKQGAMQELLTGKRRLQGYNEKWKESAIEDIGNLIRGVSFDSDSVSTSFFENSIPILRANNIVDGNLFLHDLIFVDKHFVKEHQYHRENDILICSANGSKRLVGKAALIKSDDNMSFGAFMTTLRCNNASMALYFSMFMRTDEYRKQINDLLCGSAINNLNSKQLYTIKLKHPSDQAEQHAITTILSDMDAEIAELEAKRDKYKEVRQGMMQQLLTGKIRLI